MQESVGLAKLLPVILDPTKHTAGCVGQFVLLICNLAKKSNIT